jgi:CarD family transcriptional regulator
LANHASHTRFFLKVFGRKDMPLQVGQKVAYPSQGVCMVEKIQQRTVGVDSMDFYSLRVLNDNSIIFVPLANADSVGIRPIISSIQCKKLITKLSADFEPISVDWKSRSKCFASQLQSGDVFEAADVLKKLTFLSREKKLSFREQTLLEKSKFLIVSEITNADAADEEALRAEIERLVEKACDRHTHSQPKVMSAAVH